ncbi:MAG: hypothetical protein JSR37_00355 [Verrucomicrobia bacterium]|nr:hypothetical protein [Verrucomicrobiota bacterium]MBS0636857.1 hypothetical protein [Verrucomicrobiota bacterium]
MISSYINPITDSPLPDYCEDFLLPDLEDPDETPEEVHTFQPNVVQASQPEVLDKAERRRIKNRDSARISRERKKTKLDKLEKIESAFVEFRGMVEGLLRLGVSSEIEADLQNLVELSETDIPAAIAKIQSLFRKVFTNSSEPSRTPIPLDPSPKPEERLTVSLLYRYISKNPPDYDSAFNVAQRLFSDFTDRKLKGDASRSLMNSFSSLIERGQSELSKPFFAWIHFALTHMHQINGSKNIYYIVAGYEQAVALGSQEAIIYLAEALEQRGVETEDERNRIIELYQIADISQSLFNLGYIFQKGWAGTNADGSEWFDVALINLELAEDYFRQSFAKDSTNFDALTAIGETMLLDKARLTDERQEEAIRYYNQASSMGSQEARYLLALLYRDSGQKEKAIQELTQLGPKACDDALYTDALRLLRILKDTQ